MTTKTISSTEARSNFYGIMREVTDDAVAIVIRNRGRDNAVIMSEREYNSIQETLHLMQGNNLERLRRSREQMRAGMGRVITLEDIDKMLEE